MYVAVLLLASVRGGGDKHRDRHTNIQTDTQTSRLIVKEQTIRKIFQLPKNVHSFSIWLYLVLREGRWGHSQTHKQTNRHTDIGIYSEKKTIKN